MKQLLTAEKFKLLRNPIYWTFLTGAALLSIIMLSISYSWTPEELINQGISEGPKNAVWSLTQMMSDIIILICSFPVSIIVSEEFREGTVRTILAKGYSRKNFYISKSLLGFFVSCSTFLSFMLISTLTGGFLYGFEFSIPTLAKVIGYVLLQLIGMCGITAIWVMIIFLIRRSTIATVLNVLIVLMGKFPLWILNSILSIDQRSNEDVWIVNQVMYFRTIEPSTAFAFQIIGVSLLYILIFLVIGWGVFRKAEIK